MFELANVSRPGVSEYISGSGALSALDNRLEGFKTPLIVTGENLMQLSKNSIKVIENSE